MADTSNNPAVCDALHRGVDWDGLGALKAAARAGGYNKSSWKRAQSTPPNAIVSVDDCALQVAGKLGVSLHDSRVALGLAESSQATNLPRRRDLEHQGWDTVRSVVHREDTFESKLADSAQILLTARRVARKMLVDAERIEPQMTALPTHQFGWMHYLESVTARSTTRHMSHITWMG